MRTPDLQGFAAPPAGDSLRGLLGLAAPLEAVAPDDSPALAVDVGGEEDGHVAVAVHGAGDRGDDLVESVHLGKGLYHNQEVEKI